MKKTIILFLIASSVMTTSFAQLHEAGIKGGINFANLHGDVTDNRIKIGPHLGGYINFEILEDLYLQPELLYTLVGASFKNEEVNLDYKDHLHYINIPLLARYFLNEDISLHGGVYFGAFMAGKRKGNQYGIEVDEKIENIKFMDLGLALGIDYTLNNRLIIGARYNFGVADIYKSESMMGFDEFENPYEYSYDLTLHNRVIQVFVAFPILNQKN